MNALLTVCDRCGWPALSSVIACVRCADDAAAAATAPAAPSDAEFGIELPPALRRDTLVIIPTPEPRPRVVTAAQPAPAVVSTEPDWPVVRSGRRPARAETPPATERVSTRRRAARLALVVALVGLVVGLEVRSHRAPDVSARTPVAELPWRPVTADANAFRFELPGRAVRTPAESALGTGSEQATEVAGVRMSVTTYARVPAGVDAAGTIFTELATRTDLPITRAGVSAPTAAGAGHEAELGDAGHRTLVRVVVSGDHVAVLMVTGAADDRRLGPLFAHLTDSLRR